MDGAWPPGPPATSWENWPSSRITLVTPRWWPRPNWKHWFSPRVAWTNFSTTFLVSPSTCSMRSQPDWRRQISTSLLVNKRNRACVLRQHCDWSRIVCACDDNLEGLKPDLAHRAYPGTGVLGRVSDLS